METVFENRYYADNEVLKEWISVSYKKSRIFCVIAEIIVLLCLIFCLIEQAYFEAIVEIFIFLFIVGFDFFYSRYLLGQTKKNIKELHNNQQQESVVKFSDKIYITEGSFSLSIEYSQIIKILNLKHSVVLMYGTKNGIRIKPDKFSIGNFEDFKKFINNRCENLKNIFE